MKKILFFMALLFSGAVFSQNVTTSWTDPCTGETKVVSAQYNGSGTFVSIYNQQRVFTAQEILSGAFTAWATAAYQAYSSLSPCSQSEAQTQATTQAVQQTAQEAAKAATQAVASQPVQTTTTQPVQTQTSQPTTQNQTTNGTNQTTTQSSGSQSSNQTTSSSGNTSGDGSSSSNNSSGSGGTQESQQQESTSSTENQGSENTSGETTESTQENSSTSSEGSEDNTSTESESTAGESDNTESETTENSSSEESSDSSSEDSENAESEGGTGDDSEGEGGDSEESSNDEQESEEVTEEEDKKEEESSEKESEEEKEEETTEEESEEEQEETTEEESEEEEEEPKKKKKKKKAKNTNPPIVVANISTMESLDSRFNTAFTLGVSRSSLRGDKNYGITSMVWTNFKQYMVMANFSKTFFSKGRPKFVYSTSLMGSKMFTTLTGGNNHSLVYLGEKGGVYGLSVGATAIYLNYEIREGGLLVDQALLSGAVTSFFTKPYNFDRISVSPMLAVSAPFLNYDMYQRETTYNKDLTIITGASANYALTSKFFVNLGVNVSHNTNKDIRSLLNFTIGSRFSF